MAAAIVSREPLDSATVADILRRVRERQRAVGYDGDYRKWLARVTPSDLQ
jgi:hypothetical protein